MALVGSHSCDKMSNSQETHISPGSMMQIIYAGYDLRLPQMARKYLGVSRFELKIRAIIMKGTIQSSMAGLFYTNILNNY